MVCISRRPRCGTETGDIVPEPITRVGGWITGIIAAIAIAVAVAEALGAISVAGGVITVTVGKTALVIGTAAAGGVLAGFATAVVLIVVIGTYVIDRCTQGPGLSECIGGVVNEVVESFSSTLDQLLPFSAMHDRVDVITKSIYWNAVEDGNAFVFCTDPAPPRRSEILRCYFYDRSVCDAASGALVGAGAGAVAGVIAAALVAAAIGCATIILCLIALIVAVLVAAAAVLIGAMIGGQIAKGDPESHSPTAGSGETLASAHLVTVRGNMKRRAYDSDANVIYWASSANFHGMSMSLQPFSYCEIDDELTDGCGIPPRDVIR